MFEFKLLVLLIFGIIFLMPSTIFSYNWRKNNLKLIDKEKGGEKGEEEEHAPMDLPPTTGFEDLPMLKFMTTDTNIQSNHTGCTAGLYLGSEDEYIDCAKKCNRADYTYKFIDKDSEHVLINNKKISGAYCLPISVAKCNLNNSYAIIGTGGYTCVSKFSMLLGGETGDEIIGCKSKRLRDNLLNLIYNGFIPENLFIDNIDEKTETGDYRFECDLNENEYLVPSDIGSRFESEINICNKFDSNGKIDFKNAMCKCDNYTNNDMNMTCTRCTSGWDAEIDVHGSKYGYVVARNCIDPLKINSLEPMYMPCGLKTLINNEDNDNTSVKFCEKALILATNTYSPMALENIFTEDKPINTFIKRQ